MKRHAAVLTAAAVLIASGVATAHGSGWVDPPVPGSLVPHGGYLTTTNKCKQCHAVHGAENALNVDGERLLRTTVADACVYCHVGGAGAAFQVYGGNPANWVPDTGFEHSLGLAKTVPDSADPAGTFDPATDYVIVDFRCTTCHSVHGANTLGFAILRNNPLSDADTITAGDPLEAALFCADCHDDNLVLEFDTGGVADQVSHVMTTAVSTSITSSTLCSACHCGGDYTPANSLPHMTVGKDFLKDAYDGNNGVNHELDSVCLDCHVAVGVTF